MWSRYYHVEPLWLGFVQHGLLLKTIHHANMVHLGLCRMIPTISTNGLALQPNITFRLHAHTVMLFSNNIIKED